MPEDRAVIVDTAGSQLVFTQLVGFDEVSVGFAFTVSLTSTDLAVDAADVLGKPMAIEAESGDPKRWFHGVVSAFRLVKVEERLAHYEAELRPWLWRLGLTHDCRVFQHLSVVEIIEEIFGKYPDAKFEKRLQQTYDPREYCVQFDETDLAFVQRLMDHEGIFYFFEYAEDGHTLVMTDAMAKLKPAEGYDTVPFYFQDGAARRDRDYLSVWEVTSSFLPSSYTHTDYNFEKPSLSLLAQSETEPVAGVFKGEAYRQPGAHLDLDRGDSLAAIRREELQAPHVRVRASGTIRGLASGCVFKLSGFPRDEQNDQHFVLRADYRIVDPEFRAGIGADGETYRADFVVAPAALPYRPPRLTPHPVMRGPQTVTVVGPSGEEIFTDEYARVKVQFHWDRLGKRDENSSCYVRVSSAWAGAAWGFIQIPRIGQEVIVDFLEGDPDRPIITGRVYNAAEMPPYGLPGSATQSGWKSNSTPGGGGYNELMFEDKAGSELVNFQAQKDHTLLVKNDRTKLVQHDQSDRIDNNAKHSVGVNLDEDVGKNKTTKVGVDRTINIGSNDSETVGANRTLHVVANETINVDANSTETIGANHTQTVALLQTVTVGVAAGRQRWAAEARTVGAAQVNTIGASARRHRGRRARATTSGRPTAGTSGATSRWRSAAARASRSARAGRASVAEDDGTEIGGARALKIGKGSLVEIGEDGAIKVGKACLIEAGDSIVLKCGSAAIAMKKDGTITIEGKDITVNGSGKITLKADGDITMKGSTINQN